MKTILVPTDFNELATAGLRTAVHVAKATGARIVVLYADTFAPPAEFTAAQTASIAEAIVRSKQKTAEELESWAKAVVPAEVQVEAVVKEDFPAAGILAAADDLDADLIVMGTHGRGGLARLVLGSVTETVLRETKRPVLTVTRTAETLPIRKVACADDDASPFASALVAQLGATLTASPADADLIVACKSNKTLVRQSPVPVLTVQMR